MQMTTTQTSIATTNSISNKTKAFSISAAALLLPKSHENDSFNKQYKHLLYMPSIVLGLGMKQFSEQHKSSFSQRYNLVEEIN